MRATDIAARAPVVVIGGGIGGLATALHLAPMPVIVIAKSALGVDASTPWAQGGIAAAVAQGDTPEAHARDTITAGAGLVDEALALAMAEDYTPLIQRLLHSVLQQSHGLM